VQSDDHFLTACLYVERTALWARLAPRAEDWRWGSLAPGSTSGAAAVPMLSRWPIARPPDWSLRVNMSMTPTEEEAVQRSIRRGQPYGTEPCKSARPHDWD
jgi:putative transposase